MNRPDPADMADSVLCRKALLSSRCACGELFRIEDDRIAHFVSVFVPHDGIGNDGQQHQEVGDDDDDDDDVPQCACGSIFPDIDALDSHFEDAFVPPDSRGIDGRIHTVTTLRPRASHPGDHSSDADIEVSAPGSANPP